MVVGPPGIGPAAILPAARAGPERHAHADPVLSAIDPQRHVGTRVEGMDGRGEVLGALDGLLIELHDHVVHLQPCLWAGLPGSTELTSAPEDGVRWSCCWRAGVTSPTVTPM